MQKNTYMYIDNIKSSKSSILKTKNYTLEEQAIINILKKSPKITQDEIAVQINKSIRTVKTYMTKM